MILAALKLKLKLRSILNSNMIFLAQKARQSVFEELGLNFDDLDDLQSLVDQVLSEKQAEEGFLIFLRLSPIPQYLVEGYDFKMLNRYVCLYSIYSTVSGLKSGGKVQFREVSQFSQKAKNQSLFKLF